MVMMDFINSEDDGCEPMKGPRSEPQMMSMHEEHKKIEVGHTIPCHAMPELGLNNSQEAYWAE